MNATSIEIPAPSGRTSEQTAEPIRPIVRRRRAAVLALVVLGTAATLLTTGRVEGERGNVVGQSNVRPGDVLSVGQLRISNRGPGAATILAVRAQGSPSDLAGLTIGPALVGPPGVALEPGFPPTRAPGPFAPAEGATLPARGDDHAASDLVLRIEVTDSRLHRIEGVEVTYWQHGRVHRVRTGVDILLCPAECPAP